LSKARAPLAAALVLAFAGVPANANPSLTTDFSGMSQWMSAQFAQGLAFNSGETLDPPKELAPYRVQFEPSFGVGLIPFDKRQFPQMQTPELQNGVGAALFPNTTLFPNFAAVLRMGLPWRGDVYLRAADATIPAGYKISPTMTAQVQTDSYGAGIRQHFFGGENPMLTVGAHYNHVQGYTKLTGTFGVSANNGEFNANDVFNGDIAWNINSFGLTALVSQSFGRWTPFAGIGYNYTTGSVAVNLNLISGTFLVPNISGEGSDHPEESEGREIVGVSYDRRTWTAFANAELKALGQLQYRSWIIQFGAAIPFGGRKNADAAVAPKPVFDEDPDMPVVKPAAPARGSRASPEQAPPDMIFLK
jgi:hypothetical protein